MSDESSGVDISLLQSYVRDRFSVVAQGTAVDKYTSKCTNITKDFFEETSKLALGEVLMCQDEANPSNNFRLADAMSAIELMDPKMDIGMVRFDNSICFDKLVASGKLNVDSMPLPELIATMDAMLASMMSWLEGNSLVQTLFTCVCLHDVDSIKDAHLASFCRGVLELIGIFREIVLGAAVSEEEDFNSQCFDLKKNAFTNVLSLLKASENALQRCIRQKCENSTLVEAVRFRISFLRYMILTLNAVVPPIPFSLQVNGSLPKFVPNLSDAATHMKVASNCCEMIDATISLGISQDLDTNDGDFSWLPAFEPGINRRHMPPTFPRKTALLSRKKGIDCLRKLCGRITSIINDLPFRVSSIESILSYFRAFSLNDSCAVSRSLLQLVLLPSDDHVLGKIPLSAVIMESARLFVVTPLLDPDCSIFSNPHCQSSWEDVVADFVKVFLAIIQMFGQNLARQREKISSCIEDLFALQEMVEKMENAFDFCLGGQLSELGRSITSFILYHALLLVEYHFYLSFHLELFVPYEYPYVYWYLGEIVFKWLMNAVERSNNFVISDYLKSSKKKKVDKKKILKGKKDADLKKLVTNGHRLLMLYKANVALSEAFFKFSVGMVSCSKIRIPIGDSNSERLRFEHRMRPFSCLLPSVRITYEQFLQTSKVEEVKLKGSKVCFLEAAEAFDAARSHMESYDSGETSDPEAVAVASICKRNSVVSRILSSGRKIDSRVEFDFKSSAIVFPLLKLS